MFDSHDRRVSNISKINAYLYKIARNKIIDYINRNRNRQKREEEYTIYQQGNGQHTIKPEKTNNKRKEILNALNLENPIYVELYELRVDDQLSLKEIAIIKGITERKVRIYFDKIKYIIYNSIKWP